MAIANKDFICASCGDEIKEGQTIIIQPRADRKGKNIICFRCHPETESAKVKVQISSGALRRIAEKNHRHDQQHFWQRVQ